MPEKAYKIINNIIYVIFIMTTLYAFIDIYLVKGKLPAGACPVENNRFLLYLAISLGVVSIVFSFLKKWLISKKEY